MSTATQQAPKAATNGDKAQPKSVEQREVSFVPFMAKEPITLTVGMVQHYIAKPTKSGQQPTLRDIMGFIMLCKARGLNPWEGDAFLVGYDSQDGATFNLITAHQALLKRAEVHPEYQGHRSGVIVLTANDEIVNRNGSFYLESDRLLGGWSEVHKEGKIPVEKTVKLTVYNTGRSRWKADPGGMIVKVAEAAALRAAFPNSLGGMYLAEEMENESTPERAHVERPSNLAALTARLESPKEGMTIPPRTTAAPERETVPRREATPSEELNQWAESALQCEGVDPPAPEEMSQVQAEESAELANLRRELAECNGAKRLESIGNTYLGETSPLRDEAEVETAAVLIAEKRRTFEKPGTQKTLTT